MSLLGSQGGRNATGEKNIKECLLNEEISKLRDIYQDSSNASQKVLTSLKKVITFKNQNKTLEYDSITTLNHFMEDLSSIEESLILLIQNSEADKELFVSSVIFRDSQKQVSTGFFKKMMKSHEEFKQKMNQNILRLERDIQILETNGFHIYQTNLKPNNVLSTLKKNVLEKFLISLTEIHAVFNKMKAQMSNRMVVQKRTIKTEFKNQIQKVKQCCKIIEQICLKQKLRNAMMIKQINEVRGKIENANNKIRKFEQSTKMGKTVLKNLNIQAGIESSDQPFNLNSFKKYMKLLKQKTDSLMMYTPKLYKLPSLRSKSCHTIIVTQLNCKQYKETDDSGVQSELNIIGSDFLEETLEN